ncbi:MAG: hypothetical protein BWZ02_00357 [Lentisphaerae bacterium ADurb.BinA184]|nr:MAG: hypothetical protein BWZ02_00357 [Lentisphaerae bacterium ADurb.BinA184]
MRYCLIVCVLTVGLTAVARAAEVVVYDAVQGSYIADEFPGYDTSSGAQGYVYDGAAQAGTDGWYYGWVNTNGTSETPTGSYTLMPAAASGYYRSAGWAVSDNGDYLSSPRIVVGNEAANGGIQAPTDSAPTSKGGDGDRLAMLPYTGPGHNDCAILIWRSPTAGKVDVDFSLRSTDTAGGGNHVQAWLSLWDGSVLTALDYALIEEYSADYASLTATGLSVNAGDEIQLMVGPRLNGAYDGSLMYGDITLTIPEPASALLLGLAGMLAVRRRR